jgi:hypothetical protein
MDTKIAFKVTSSSGEPYNIQFKFSDNQFTVLCSCQAGMFGKLCKHKTGLLDGDPSLLFDKTDQETLELVHDLVKKSRYREIISSYNILKKEMEEAQKKEKRLKEQIEYALKTGVEIVS